MKEIDVKSLLGIFRQWVEDQKPILNSITTDEFLLRFLRVSNFQLKEAKERLIQFWKYRTENPKWFSNRDLIENPAMRQISETAYCFQLPKKTAENRFVFVMRIGHYNSSCFNLDDVTKYAFAVSDVINSQESVQTDGMVILLDMSEVNLQHVPQFTADFSRRYVDCWEKMYPVNLSQIHFYNYPNLFDPVYGLFRSLYYSGFDDRIFIHTQSDEKSAKNPLHQHIDPSILPKEYDGQLGSMDEEINRSFVQWTREHNQLVKEMENYGVDLKQISQLLEKVRQG